MKQLPNRSLRERVSRLERIIEISRSLNSTLSLRPLLEEIILAARDLTSTEASSILLVDRRTGELRFAAASGVRGQESSSVTVPMEGSVAGWVVRHNEAVVIPDARCDARLFRQADEQVAFETHSLIAAPLRVQGRVIGVLEAVNKTNGQAFDPEDVETLTTLADQAAVAIENAVLFEQSDLVAEMVHEMRTPLTSIAGYAAMILRDDVSAQQRAEFANTIVHEAQRLSRMADDFLELARLESGRAFLAQEQVELERIVREAVTVLKPEAEQKAIGIRVAVPERLPPVTGDAGRLRQTLINLLANAVKYCRPGDQVTVTGQAAPDHVTIGVADTGPGIPRLVQERLFERFYRPPAGPDSPAGTGLGLAISRRIIEAHGGKIWVESEEGQGAAFYFTLPVSPAGYTSE